MKWLFNGLYTGRSGCNVNDVKRYGPKSFVQSNTQEDAHQYLLNVFETIEN